MLSAGYFNTCVSIHTTTMTTGGGPLPTINHRLLCWGNNFTDQTNTPHFDSKIALINIGLRHICASTVASTFALQCWGVNDRRRVEFPTHLGNISITDMATTSFSTCAGSINKQMDLSYFTCWGENIFGELDIPSGLSNKIMHISGGSFFYCSILITEVKCWGRDEFKQLNSQIKFDLYSLADIKSA